MKTYLTMENGIKIVEYDNSLAPALAELFSGEREDWGGDNTIRTPEQIIREHEASSFYNEFVALDGDVAVGYCSLGRYFGDADAMYINFLDVHPDYQGKKIGKAMTLLCVERAIEMGYPRLDIHTWAGNTKAVPVYKKAGFLWEDRGDSTHLVNFIPTVLACPLLGGFFQDAHWYDDSAKQIEIVPDEVKINKFGTFGYIWQKGESRLAVDFERSGRRMYAIETNDYKIRLMAENHVLAFGMSYNCKFEITNKSGAPLNVQITGKNNKNITFDYHLNEQITGEREFAATFAVAPISEPQNKWTVHPCLLANIVINGKAAELGLGIMPKFPLDVTVERPPWPNRMGVAEECHLNITSSMAQDCTVSFSLPANDFAAFEPHEHEVSIPANGKISLNTSVVPLKPGHVALPISYKIMSDGKVVNFEKPLHVINRDFSAAFAYENEEMYAIENGVWRLRLRKNDNGGAFANLLYYHDSDAHVYFPAPKPGKPFADEFDLLKPKVSMYKQDSEMVLEAAYTSKKFPGIVVTQIFTMSAGGHLTTRFKIENTSDKAQEAWVWDGSWLPLGERTVFAYGGKITTNEDSHAEHLDDIEPEDFTENWIFEHDPGRTPFGVCWPADYTPGFQWGDGLYFEHNAGTLAPGAAFETQAIEFFCGVFPNHDSLRNYALGRYSDRATLAENAIEISPNNHNPFFSGDELEIEVINNRNDALEGEITALGHTESISGGETTEDVCFSAEVERPNGGIGLFKIEMSLIDYEKTFERAVFFPTNGNVDCVEENGVFTVQNGQIAFKADPTFAPAVFSLTTSEGEWLKSNYPDRSPFAYWNPFIGGIYAKFSETSTAQTIKEPCRAEFVNIPDNFGNIWTGICTTTEFVENEDKKGAVLQSYYLTQPDLPVLCHFFKYTNGTGNLQNEEFYLMHMLDTGPLTENTIELTDMAGHPRRLKVGAVYCEVEFERLMRVRSGRRDSLYVYRAKTGAGDLHTADSDNKHMSFGCELEARVPAGGAFTSSPTFLILTQTDLTEQNLADLERIVFDENH